MIDLLNETHIFCMIKIDILKIKIWFNSKSSKTNIKQFFLFTSLTEIVDLTFQIFYRRKTIVFLLKNYTEQ